MITPSEEFTRTDLLYEDVIDGYLDDRFVERPWLARLVERHLDDPVCRFILLSGGPGTGKSAFLAWLTRRHILSPRYFIRRLSNRPFASGDAWSLLLSLGHQIAVLRPEVMRLDLKVEVVQDIGCVAAGGEATGVEIHELRTSPFHRTAVQVEQHVDTVEGRVVGLKIERMIADSRLNDLGNLQGLALLDPAVRLARQDSTALIVVLIDALDELRYQWSAFAGRGDVLEWLGQCPDLPPNLRIVITSRPDRHLLQRFRLAQADQLREEEIKPSAEEVFNDLLTYAERLLAELPLGASLTTPPGTATRLARRVAERAGGSFLYLVMWGRALRQAHESDDENRINALTDLSVLPLGLDGIYQYFLVLVRDTVVRREGWPGWKGTRRQVYRPLLSVLTVAQAPLTSAHLAMLTGLREKQDDIAQALADLTQFLEWDGAGARLCHISLAEFLTQATEDDWHVVSDENHYEVARRLIAAQHGESWETCEDEYAMANTVVHLVAALRTAQSTDAENRSGNLLSQLLTDPGFGIAKATRVGVDKMLGDYVAAHTALRRPASNLLPGITTGLADVMAYLAARGVPDLPDTLHAVVGYRPDAAALNEGVLHRLSDPDFLGGRIPDETKRTRTIVGFAHAEATRLRRIGNPDSMQRARRILEGAISSVEEQDRSALVQQLSSLFYDLAYLHYLYGDHDNADELFRRSIEAAEQAGDRTGAYISQLVALRMEFLRNTVDPGTFRATVTEALEFFESDGARKPHAERWVMNAHACLLDLATLTGDAEAARTELEILEEDPWILRFSRSDLTATWRARVALVSGDSAQACARFEEQLRHELVDPPPSREELARDLLDYGSALLAAGDAVEARRIWQLGLRCPDDAASWPWKPRITQALKALGTAGT